MGLFGAGQFIRPRSVAIYRKLPGSFAQFVLDRVSINNDQQVRLDLTESENDTRTWTAPEHPVAQGLPVSDQTRRDLVQFSVTGYFTATPLGFFGVLQGIGGQFLRRDLKAFDHLLTIAGRGEPVIVVTPEVVFPSMGIRSIVRQKGADDGDEVKVTIGFREIRIVAPLIGESLLDMDAVLFGAGETADGGSQTPEDLSSPLPSGLSETGDAIG